MSKYEIHETTDYLMFKRLKGNRSIEKVRVRKIRESIEKVGYIPNPIIVNEKIEIIDGQARKQVCEELGLPILYIIVPGASALECIAMNISATNWNMGDYVKMYIEDGIDDYERLNALVENHSVSLSVAVCAATGLMTTNNESVKDGTFSLDESQYAIVDQMLDYVDSFSELIKKHGVSNSAMLKMALCFIYQHPDIDNETMRSQFKKYGYKMISSDKSSEVFECLTEIYNTRKKKGKVYIATKYYEYVDAKYPWYGNKWGNAKSISDEMEA